MGEEDRWQEIRQTGSSLGLLVCENQWLPVGLPCSLQPVSLK